MDTNGRSCEEHALCGSVLEENMVVRLRRVQVLVEGREKTVIACIWVTDGVDRCRVGFLMHHMVAHTMRYDGALVQITLIYSGNADECSTAERRLFHAKRGCCDAAIILCLPDADNGHRARVEENAGGEWSNNKKAKLDKDKP